MNRNETKSRTAGHDAGPAWDELSDEALEGISGGGGEGFDFVQVNGAGSDSPLIALLLPAVQSAR